MENVRPAVRRVLTEVNLLPMVATYFVSVSDDVDAGASHGLAFVSPCWTRHCRRLGADAGPGASVASQVDSCAVEEEVAP